VTFELDPMGERYDQITRDKTYPAPLFKLLGTSASRRPSQHHALPGLEGQTYCNVVSNLGRGRQRLSAFEPLVRQPAEAVVIGFLFESPT
jgi:hypothetical protein